MFPVIVFTLEKPKPGSPIVKLALRAVMPVLGWPVMELPPIMLAVALNTPIPFARFPLIVLLAIKAVLPSTMVIPVPPLTLMVFPAATPRLVRPIRALAPSARLTPSRPFWVIKLLMIVALADSIVTPVRGLFWIVQASTVPLAPWKKTIPFRPVF